MMAVASEPATGRNEMPSPQFLLCIKNEAYRTSLEMRKVYQMIPDAAAASRRYVRIIDESGEDYLYPEDYFVPIELPRAAKNAFATTTP
jgi:hypothetical protein